MDKMNLKVRNENMDKVMGKWWVHGQNENGDQLVEIYAEHGLFQAKHL